MYRTLLIESAAQGLLYVNGQFCGPMEKEGQAFPIGKSAEVYIQLFPFGAEHAPLSAQLLLRDGAIERLQPETCCYALLWPDGVIQLELRPPQEQDRQTAQDEAITPCTLLRYLSMRLAGDAKAQLLWLRPQDEAGAPDLSAYHAAVPLRYAPLDTGEGYDECAGLVRRVAPNAAAVDAAFASVVPAGQGRRLIERMTIHSW